jgi:hypothetical protein
MAGRRRARPRASRCRRGSAAGEPDLLGGRAGERLRVDETVGHRGDGEDAPAGVTSRPSGSRAVPAWKRYTPSGKRFG